MRAGYSCVAIMASVGVMVVEIGWQGKKQEELWDQDLETGTYHCPLSYILTAICKKKGGRLFEICPVLHCHFRRAICRKEKVE